MITAFILLFGGMAIVSTFEAEQSIDDEHEADSDHSHEKEQPEDLLGIDDGDNETPTIMEALNGNANSEVEHGKDEVEETTIVDIESDFRGSSELGSNSELHISVDDISALPSALTDWVHDDNVLHVELGEQNTISIVLQDGALGSLIVVDANYTELSVGEDGETITENCGSNIYFVPEGETFPMNYEWSAEGATLVDIEDYENEEVDFGGIKLLARVDSGLWIVQHQDGLSPEIIYDDRMGDPTINSNVSIQVI